MTTLQMLLESVAYQLDDSLAKLALRDWLLDHPEDLLEVINSLAYNEWDPDPADKRFAETEFVVQATNCEALDLWREWSTESPTSTWPESHQVSWLQDNPGLWIQLGTIAGRNVGISCQWNILNGHRVLFWDKCGTCYDHFMVDRWLDKHCAPRYDKKTRLAYTDAMNFVHCLNYCRGERQ